MTKMGEIHLRGDSGRDTLLGIQPQQCHCQPRSSARPPQHLPVGFIFYGLSGGLLFLRIIISSSSLLPRGNKLTHFVDVCLPHRSNVVSFVNAL